jgi:glycosyltransferase involved in cell wall biosynthesis
LKILRITNEIGPRLPSGPARMAYNLTAGLARKGIESLVFTNNCEEKFQSDLVTVRVFKTGKSVGSYRLNTSMFSELLRQDCDIVHVHGYRNFESDAGASTAFLKSRPLVMTCHGTVLGPLNQVWSLGSRFLDLAYDGFTARFSIRQANSLVATSQREAEEIASFGMNKAKISIIPNAVDLASVPRTERKNDGFVRVLIVSRLTFKNNIEMAIRGFAGATRKNDKLRLRVVGDESASRFVGGQETGYKARLFSLCKELGLRDDQVEFTGWLTGQPLWDAYLDSDVFVWTSRYDNFAHALVEAANFNLPIVSTDVGVASDIVGRNQEGGFIVPQEDVEALVRALVILAEQPGLRKKMGAQNKSKSLEFGVERMVDSYIRIYRNLLECH